MVERRLDESTRREQPAVVIQHQSDAERHPTEPAPARLTLGQIYQPPRDAATTMCGMHGQT
jgi:hypothetical protein